MKKFLYIILVSFVIYIIFSPDFTAFASEKNLTISNSLFSITLPEYVKNTYKVKKKKDTILIYDKISKKSGFGGLAFGIKAYKNPSDHAMMPGGRKLGELTDKHNNIYDIVLIQPTDVQYDYVKGESKTYKNLYSLGEMTTENKLEIKGLKGKYKYGQGCLGKDLYKDILNKHYKAIAEKWDSIKLEKENMSYMYNVLRQNNKNVLNKIGYYFYDTNGDGIEELLIGEIAQNNWKGVIYDIYTMVNRKPKHVISGGTRNRYYICDDSFICNEYSSGALESGWLVYILVENSTELFPQVGFKYDGYKNKKNPWFLSYNFDKDEWENVSEKKFKERKLVFEKYERFNFIPFSKLK